MGKRFSSLLLAGKTATLPALMQQAHAYTPSYTDILNPQVTQIELPVSGKVNLNTLGSDIYNGSVTLCTNTGVTNEISLVVTGLRNGDLVYVLASTDLGGNEALNPRIRIGNQNITIPVIINGVVAPEGSTVAVSVPLNLSQLSTKGFSLNSGSTFYLQTVVLPSTAFVLGRIEWSAARVSEVDALSVSSCSTYGPHGGFY